MHDDSVCSTTALTGDPYNKPSPVLLSNIAGVSSTDVRTGDPHKTSPTRSNNIAGVSFKLAELHYIDVDVFGANYCWKSLLDSGTEVDCINMNKLIQMSVPHTIVGDIALRPMAGLSIPAQLVKINVRISSDREQPNHSDFVEIVAAACDDLHDEIILSEPTLQCLIDSCHSHVNLFDDGVTNSSSCGDVCAVTRSRSRAETVVDNAGGSCVVGDPNEVVMATDESNDVDSDESFLNPDAVDVESMIGNSSDKTALAVEQLADESLKTAFALARRNKGGYTIKNGLLFQVGTVCDQPLCSIVVPAGRRLGVMKLAHNSVQWAARKTKQRIILSGITWPTMASDVMNYCATCSTCQMRARQMRTDKVPISIVEKAGQGQVFQPV